MQNHRIIRNVMKTSPLIIIIIIIIISFTLCPSVPVNAETRLAEGPQFGLVFQDVTDYSVAAQRYGFSWGLHKQIEKLIRNNRNGIYLRYYNLTQTSPELSRKLQPDYVYITTKHPEWLRRNKDGSLVLGPQNNPCLDLGNPQYVAWVINWLKEEGFNGEDFRGHLALDCGMFLSDHKWAKYSNDKDYQDAWEYFLRSISKAFRPRYKAVLNVGTCDLSTFARMVQWVDGVLHEGLGPPLHNPEFNLARARQLILDKWQKGQWCTKNGKIWAVRYNTTTDAIKLNRSSGKLLSVTNNGMIISNSVKGTVQIDFSQADTIGKVAQALKTNQVAVTFVNPYAETASQNTFQPIHQARLDDGLTLKLKTAPKEAFIFGYAAFLMAAGANCYYIMGGTNTLEYYYPEMDWKMGAPRGEMHQVSPEVYRRDFQNYSAFLNLSTEPYRLPDSRILPPLRGAIMRPPAGL